MNFFKPTKTKIILSILTVLTTWFVVYFLRNPSVAVSKINEIILIILIVILFIPVFASVFASAFASEGISLIIPSQPSQKSPLDGMPGYIHPVDPDFIFFTILLIPCLRVYMYGFSCYLVFLR